MGLILNASKDPEYWDPIYKKTLIIIDFQKDFIDGSLAVPGAKDAENAIVNYIENNHEAISNVLFTVDWHSPNHCSFKKNGGIWPIHCVQFSEGAGISDKIIQACISHNLKFNVFKKGNNDITEEYGAFQYIGINGRGGIIVRNEFFQELVIPNTEFVVCGLAGDYCVKETLNNLIQFNKSQKEFRSINKDALMLNIEVFKDGVASIDDGTTFNNFIKENNLKTI